MHELSNLWFNYFWSSLKGNGPEALVQTVVYAIVGVALIPVVRKWLKKEAAKAEAEAKGLVNEAEKIERDLLKPVRAVWKFISGIRVTVKKDTPVVEAAVAKEVSSPPAPLT